jgi:hypothetical protein
LVAVLLCLSWVALAGGARAQENKNRRPALRKRGALPITGFYETPVPLSPGKPGELIRSEEFDQYYLGEELSAVRILYHSRSGNGEDVAASGVVLIPDRKAPPGGWPILAWAHDWTGTARQCAPSLMRNLGSGPFLSMYASLGYVVVAADYTGLGTNFRNAFVDIQSNALDVIYSVTAARAAVPRLGSKWIAMGQMDGGLAALGVAEAESEIRDAGYLGSIAISGLADLRDAYERSAQGSSQEMAPLLAYGIKTIFPRFDPGEILTEKGLGVYRQTETSCRPGAGAEAAAGGLMKPDWEKNGMVQQFFSRNTLGQKRAHGPLLVLGAESDPALKANLTSHLVSNLCKQGDRVQFIRYPGLDAGGVLGGSVRDQIGWIQSRFKGKLAPANCR